MKLASYPDYKKTGLIWAPQLPAHWEVHRLKVSVDGCKNGIWGEAPDGVDDLICVRVADFNRTAFRVVEAPSTKRAIEPSQRNGRLLKKGDLLIEKSGGGENQLVGCVVIYDRDEEAVCSNFIARMPIARGMDPRFWCYAHAAIYAARLNFPAIKQTTGIQNLDSSEYLNIRVGYPPLDEQRAIVRFLDAKTAEIDALIAKNQRLLDLLAEQRSALITRGVTKGLNPNASTKLSRTTWLDDIPVNWHVSTVRRVVNDVFDGPHFSPKYVSDGVPFLSARNVKIDGWSLDDAKFVTEEDFAEFSKRGVPEIGDVLYTKGGTTGVARVVDLAFRFQVWVHIAVLKPRADKVDSRFLAHALNSAPSYQQAQLYTRGATNNDLGLTRLVNIVFALPPLDEQRSIIEYLNLRLSRIDNLKQKIRHAIAFLTELRSALITTAVTGQIDVRGWQPQKAAA